MSWFVVRFMKDVLGENGRQCEVCQSIVEVYAANENEAAEAAKQTFCRTQHLSDWSLHADRINVRAADFPSWGINGEHLSYNSPWSPRLEDHARSALNWVARCPWIVVDQRAFVL